MDAVNRYTLPMKFSLHIVRSTYALQQEDKVLKLSLYPYQQLAVQHILKHIDAGHHRLYFSLPTGTGKSKILAALAKILGKSGRVCVLIHRQDIAMQLAKTMHEAGLEVGLLMQDHREMSASVIVATIQSLTPDTLQELLWTNGRPVGGILIDEAHHAVPGSAYERVIIAVEQASPTASIPVVGATATPYRYDKQSMHSLLPTCAFERTIPDMVQGGWLAPLTWKPIHVDINLSTILTQIQDAERDYEPDALASQLVRQAITQEIVRAVAIHIEQRPTLVFAASVEHAQQLAAAFCRQGFSALAISGKQRSRARMFADWRSGRIQIVCNCSLLTEGFDFPEIAALVIARPTRSPGLYLQMLGRGMRTAPGKTDCLILDVVGNQPDTSRQVVLPQVIDNTQAAGGHAPTTSGSKEDSLLQKMLGAKVATEFTLLDPIGQSGYRWVPYQEGPYEGYFARVDRRTVVITERDQGGSGLYRSRLHIQRPKERAEDSWISPDYLPLRQQVALVHEKTGHSTTRAFSDKEAAWLQRPASERQFQMLQRMYPKAVQIARDEAWTQQQASDFITFRFLRRTLTHPPKRDGTTNETAS